MSFTIYALLSDSSLKISNEMLSLEVENKFGRDKGFSWEFEELPFEAEKTLALRWDGWFVSVAYEEGDDVKNDSREIQKILGDTAPIVVSNIFRRIRVLFSDDVQREHTNEIIRMMEFLSSIKGAVLYDVKKKEVIVLQ